MDNIHTQPQTDPSATEAEAQAFNVRDLPVKPLPQSKGEMLAARLKKKASSFNDIIENFMLEHWEDEELNKYLGSNDNDDSPTGRTDYDDLMAAKRLQELADEAGIVPIVAEKLTGVKRAMGVALRRYGATRKQRLADALAEAEAQAAAHRSRQPYGTVVE